jgi:hypothetical protein
MVMDAPLDFLPSLNVMPSIERPEAGRRLGAA